jgi:hypothetical protein
MYYAETSRGFDASYRGSSKKISYLTLGDASNIQLPMKSYQEACGGNLLDGYVAAGAPQVRSREGGEQVIRGSMQAMD